MISLKSIEEAHSGVPKCRINKLVYPQNTEWVFGACLIKIHEINIHFPFPGFFLDNYCVGQPFRVKNLFDSPSLLKFVDLLLNRIGMFLGRPSRLLFPQDCLWIYIQVMAYEFWINSRSFVHTLNENIWISPQKIH